MFKLGILDAYVCKNIYIKEKLGEKLRTCYWRLVLINQVFARILTTFGFRCRIISVKPLMLGVNMLLNFNDYGT